MATKIKSGVIGTLDSNLVFADNSKAIFGAGSDLQIYHTGSYSVIKEAGDGDLEIQTNGSEVQLTGNAGTDYMLRAISNGAVNLYHDNSLKLATTSTGIDVTGVITSKADAALNDAQIGRLNFTNTNSNSSSNPIRASILAGRQNSAWGGYLSLYTSTGTDAASEKVRITETGNVGIGTSSPSYTLTIGTAGTTADTTMLIGSGAGSAGNLFFGDAASGVGSYRGFVQYDHNTDSMRFGTVSAERMRIDSSGRLLAGTQSVGARSAHTLARTGGFVAEVIQQQTSAGASVLGLTYDGAAPNNTTDYFVYARDTAGIKHLVRANGDGYYAGNVGIGTDSPGFPLHVNSSSTDVAKFQTSGSYAYTRFQNSSKTWALSVGNDFGFYDEAASATRMLIDSSGRVKIGTTSTNHDGKFNLAGTGGAGVQVYMQHNETYVVGQLIGSAGVSTKTATLVFATNHLRAQTIEMETSGHKYNNGGDFWHTRHFYTCMSEGANTRTNSRISNHEFEEGGTNRMTTSLTKTSGSNVWTAVITIEGEYQGNFHFRMKGYGAVNCPTSLTIA